MHLTHPFRIAACQVVVHRDHMHTSPGERIEIAGEGGNKRFALAGFHFSNLPLMQHHATNHLHVEVTHAQHPLAGFPNDGEGFSEQIVQNWTLFF